MMRAKTVLTSETSPGFKLTVGLGLLPSRRLKYASQKQPKASFEEILQFVFAHAFTEDFLLLQPAFEAVQQFL